MHYSWSSIYQNGNFFVHDQTQHNSDLVLCKTLPIGLKDQLTRMATAALTIKAVLWWQKAQSATGVLAMLSKCCKIKTFFWKDWKAGTTSCRWIMFITKQEWSYTSRTAFSVSISIFFFFLSVSDIGIVPGGSADCSTSDVPLFWTTLSLGIRDRNEAGSLGFWSAYQEKRILRFIYQPTISQALIQGTILSLRRKTIIWIATKLPITRPLIYRSKIQLGELIWKQIAVCDISQLGYELDCPKRNQVKHVQAQPQHWLQLLHTLQIHILKYTNYL